VRRFRGLRYFWPSWLTGKGDGDKIAYTLEALADVFVERIRLGLEARMPGRAGDSALRLITGDRGLLRGRSETEAELAPRLKAWRTPRTHAVRGNAYEALLQIWYYWGGIYAATVDAHGLRHVIEADDAPDVDTLPNPDTLAVWLDGGNTAWDGADPDVQWSRFWIILRPPASMGVEATPDLGDPDLWGGALGTPGFTLGQVGVTPDDVSAMRALFQEYAWGPGNSVAEWCIVALDPDAAPEPEPDGQWRYWSTDDVTRVASRSTDFRYWSMAPEYNNTYTGLRSRAWPNSAFGVDGTEFIGDRTNADAWDVSTLPNGVEYAGTRARFPVRVLLCDDGSIPQ
jgi:hypothetical protein